MGTKLLTRVIISCIMLYCNVYFPADLESAPLKTPENKTDPVEGSSLLYTCLDKLTKVSFSFPTQK